MFRTHRLVSFRCLVFVQPVRTSPRILLARAYATRSSASDLLSETLDTKRQSTRRDSVGPFGLGISPSAQSAQNAKQWSELGTGGKAMRATARTSNFVVIVLGGGLTVLLLYALISELFSKNSPTVLYAEACKMINNSPQIARYLHAPLVFHNNPPSVGRPRHRNRHVSSQRAVDSWGREHMILNFYVQGSDRKSIEQDDSNSFLDSITHWFSNVSEMSFDDVVDETKERVSRIMENSKSLVRFLSGESESSSTSPSYPYPETAPPEKKEESVLWNLTGLFAGIRGRNKGGDSTIDSLHGKTFTEGEVRVDCILNTRGYYEFFSLEVYIPSLRSSNPIKIQLV